MKKSVLISNIILLFWYFLAMIGIKIGDKYLVEGSFKDEWIFMLIPIATFLLMLFTKKNTSSDMARNVVCHSISKPRMVYNIRKWFHGKY